MPSNKWNRCHLSLYFVGTRKMQAPKPYENHRLGRFLWDPFEIGDFDYETVGFPIKPLHYCMPKTIPNTTCMKFQTVRHEIRLDRTKKQQDDQHIKKKDITFPTLSSVVYNFPSSFFSFVSFVLFIILNHSHGLQSLN